MAPAPTCSLQDVLHMKAHIVLHSLRSTDVGEPREGEAGLIRSRLQQPPTSAPSPGDFPSISGFLCPLPSQGDTRGASQENNTGYHHWGSGPENPDAPGGLEESLAVWGQ